MGNPDFFGGFLVLAIPLVALATLKTVAAVPLNLTAVAPVRLAPVMVTEVPTGPEDGVKLVIVGAGITVKLPVLVTAPPGVVMAIVPVVSNFSVPALTTVSPL